MWKIKIYMILFFILNLLIIQVHGTTIQEYDIEEIIPFSLYFSDFTGPLTGASCNIQIKNPFDTILVEDTMVNKRGGWYEYNYTTAKTGYHYCKENCTTSNSFGSGTCDFIVTEDKMIFLIYLFMALSIIFFIFGIYRQDRNFIFASGFLFCIIGIWIFRFGFAGIKNLVTESFAIVLIGIGIYILSRTIMESLEDSDM